MKSFLVKAVLFQVGNSMVECIRVAAGASNVARAVGGDRRRPPEFQKSGLIGWATKT